MELVLEAEPALEAVALSSSSNHCPIWLTLKLRFGPIVFRDWPIIKTTILSLWELMGSTGSAGNICYFCHLVQQQWWWGYITYILTAPAAATLLKNLEKCAICASEAKTTGGIFKTKYAKLNKIYRYWLLNKIRKGRMWESLVCTNLLILETCVCWDMILLLHHHCNDNDETWGLHCNLAVIHSSTLLYSQHNSPTLVDGDQKAEKWGQRYRLVSKCDLRIFC